MRYRFSPLAYFDRPNGGPLITPMFEKPKTGSHKERNYGADMMAYLKAINSEKGYAHIISPTFGPSRGIKNGKLRMVMAVYPGPDNFVEISRIVGNWGQVAGLNEDKIPSREYTHDKYPSFIHKIYGCKNGKPFALEDDIFVPVLSSGRWTEMKWLVKDTVNIVNTAETATNSGANVCADNVSEVQMIQGIDISRWEDNPAITTDDIQWDKVKESDIRFAILKATEGNAWVDPMFYKFTTATIPIGAYHFFRFAADPIVQAKHFLKTIDPVKDKLFCVVLDVEEAISNKQTAFANSVKAWLDYVENALKKRPIIYTSANYWQYVGNPAWSTQYQLWVANYGVTNPLFPRPWTSWVLWQYSDKGIVPGIKEQCDMNYFNGDETAFAMFIGGVTQPTPLTLEQRVARIEDKLGLPHI